MVWSFRSSNVVLHLRTCQVLLLISLKKGFLETHQALYLASSIVIGQVSQLEDAQINKLKWVRFDFTDVICARKCLFDQKDRL